MKKELTCNVYTDAWINKNNELVIGDAIFDCDISQLLPGSHVDDDLYLVSKEGKFYDLNDADVIAEIGLDNIEIIDGEDNGNVNGSVISTVYKGDHYAVMVRTEEEEDFIIDTVYTWNIGDIVSLKVNPQNIKITLKGSIDKYEKE